jgi:hypothetical protein
MSEAYCVEGDRCAVCQTTEIVENLAMEIGQGKEGGTFARNGLVPTSGYFVGGLVPELILGEPGEATRDRLRAFVKSTDANLVGYWVNEETGRIHLDAVDWYQEESAAVAVGKVRGELAVWDVANAKEIRLS